MSEITYEDRSAELEDAIKATEIHHRRWDYQQSLYRNGSASEDLKYAAAANKRLVTVNLAFANVRSLASLILPAKHRVFAKARRSEDVALVPIAESLMDYAWRKQKIKQELRRSLYDALIFGNGFLKVGFGSEFGPSDKDLKRLKSFSDAILEAAGVVGKPTQKATPFRKGRGDMRVEYNPNVRSTMPWVLRVSPYCVFPDPMTDRMENGRFVAIKTTRVLEDVKRDPLYKNTDTLVPDGYLGGDADPSRQGVGTWRDNPAGFSVIQTTSFDQALTEKKRSAIIHLFEFWDKRTQEYYVLKRQNGLMQYLRGPEPWPFPALGSFPIFGLTMNVSPNELWSISEIEPIWRNQMELNQIRMFMLEHVKRCAQHRVLAPMEETDDTLARLTEPDYSKIEKVSNPQGFRELDLGQLKPEVYNVSGIIQQDILQVSGLSANQRGAAEDTTATESSIIESNVALLTESRRNDVREFAGEVLNAYFTLWRNAISSEQLIEIVGDEAIGKIVATDAENAVGTFDFDIELQESVAQNLAVKRTQLIETIQLLAQLYAQQLLPGLNLNLLVHKLLEISDIADRDKILPEEREQMDAIDMQQLGMSPDGGMGGQMGMGGEEEGASGFGSEGSQPAQSEPGDGNEATPSMNGILSQVGGQPNLKRGSF